MKTKHLLLIAIPFLLSACSLSSEKAATTTVSPKTVSVYDTTPSETNIPSPTPTADPLDNQNITDQDLSDILDDLDSDLNIDSDIKDLDQQLK